MISLPVLEGGDERLRETLVFFLRLLVLAVPLYGLLFFADLYPLQLAVASSSAWLLESAGFLVVQEGISLTVGGFWFFISPDSTAWKSMLFLGALIVAVPGIAWRKRLLGVGVGIVLIFIGNLGRVLSIVFTEQAFGLETAMLVHDVGWRFGLVGLVLAIWLVWYRRVRK